MANETLTPPPQTPPQKAQPALAPHPAVPPAGHTRWWAVLLLVLILAAAAFAVYWFFFRTAPVAADAKNAKSRITPVVTAAAYIGDLPIYFEGIGTVTALNTVTVRTRVDGELTKVAFKEGQAVKKGDLLVQIDPRPYQVQLEQAKAQLAKDQATLANDKKNLDRYNLAKDAIPQQQIDTAEATVAQDEGLVGIDQSAIDNANLQLTYCRITAPISGRIGLRLVDEGNMVHAADTTGLLVINQVQPITIEFTLPQDDLPAVLKAQLAGPVTAIAFDRDLTNKLATGKLSAIDNQINPATGTFLLKAEYENTDNSLFPQQFVNVKLRVDTIRSAVLVPDAAVQQSPQGTFAYVVDPKTQTVSVRTLETGSSEAAVTVITKGLDAGEVVVTDGVDKLQDGSEVKEQKPEGADATQPGPPRHGRRSGAASQPAATPANQAETATTKPAHAHVPTTRPGSRVLEENQ